MKQFFLKSKNILIQLVLQLQRSCSSHEFHGMQLAGANDDPNSYWQTKVYFNETLPASRGFSKCLLDEAAEGATWMDHWQRELNS